MGELPLFRIIGRALWLVVANLFTLVRLTWLPLGVLLAAQVAIGQTLAASAGGSSEALLEASPYASPAFWSSAVLQTIALSVVAVRVHRLAIFGDTRPGEYFAFPFGRTEALYVTMIVLFLGGIFCFIFGVALLLELIEGGLALAGIEWKLPRNDVVTYIGVTLLAVGFFASIWFALRMVLWAPMVVANDALAMGATWRLTRGVTWQMFWLFFLTANIIAFAFLFAGMLSGDVALMYDLLDQLQNRHALFGGWVNPSVHSFAGPLVPERIAIDLGLTFFFTTFMAALLSYAYLEVKDRAAPAEADAEVAAA